MKKTSIALSAICGLAVLVSTPAQAITVDVNQTWPVAPDLQTHTGADAGPTETSLITGRTLRQSFVLGSDIDVSAIYLGVEGFRPEYTLTLGIYTITDPLSADQAVWDAGVLFTSVTVPANTGLTPVGPASGTATTNADTHNLRINLDTPISLTANTGGNGYYLQLTTNAPTTAEAHIFKWDVAGTDTALNSYIPGRRDDHNAGIPAGETDYVMALVPEPTTSAMLMGGVVLLTMVRRRRA